MAIYTSSTELFTWHWLIESIQNIHHFVSSKSDYNTFTCKLSHLSHFCLHWLFLNCLLSIYHWITIWIFTMLILGILMAGSAKVLHILYAAIWVMLWCLLTVLSWNWTNNCVMIHNSTRVNVGPTGVWHLLDCLTLL